MSLNDYFTRILGKNLEYGFVLEYIHLITCYYI